MLKKEFMSFEDIAKKVVETAAEKTVEKATGVKE